MSTKREEEKNEKIIRGLLKLPPNRKCINCNSVGPQYVCTNFWTFICTPCSGIHREFTHRVKSVSMAKFTTQEVEALQKGGNQVARETFLKDWDMQRMRFPNSSNPDKIREFIKDVYVNKKYAGGKLSSKPPRDAESVKNHELEQRRASSYHSFSQSPPYEYQYEDRRYGKQFGMLNRKPGSDRGQYDVKTNSFIYSPGRLHMQTYDDRFTNESSGSRMSDFSVSSLSDTFRYDGQSLNSQETGSYSPSLHHGREGIPCPKRTSSAGSSVSHRSFGSVAAGDASLEPMHSSGTQQAKIATFSSTHSSTSLISGNSGLICSTVVQGPNASSQSINLFANFDDQPPSVGQVDYKPESNIVSHLSFNSVGAVGVALDPVHSSGTPAKTSMLSSIQTSTSINSTDKVTFDPTFVKQSNCSTPSIDFADFNNQPLSVPAEHKLSAVQIPQNEGWATFDLPHHARVGSALNPGTSASEHRGSGVPRGNVDQFVFLPIIPDRLPVQNPVASNYLPVTSDQWHLGQEQTGCSEQNDLQQWNSFNDSTKVLQSSVGDLPHNRSWITAPDTALHDPNLTVKYSEGGISKASESTNPFDIPYDPNLESMNPIREIESLYETASDRCSFLRQLALISVFLDTSSLEAALPSAQLAHDYLAGVPKSRYSQNPAATYVSSLPEGGFQYMSGQGANAHFPSFPPQGPGASVGGNPFA